MNDDILRAVRVLLGELEGWMLELSFSPRAEAGRRGAATPGRP